MENVFDVLLACLDFYKHVASSLSNYDTIDYRKPCCSCQLDNFQSAFFAVVIVLLQVFTKIKRSKQTKVRQNSLFFRLRRSGPGFLWKPFTGLAKTHFGATTCIYMLYKTSWRQIKNICQKQWHNWRLETPIIHHNIERVIRYEILMLLVTKPALRH
jgi:hypothetical protein